MVIDSSIFDTQTHAWVPHFAFSMGSMGATLRWMGATFTFVELSA
jgi:hypothetical protein